MENSHPDKPKFIVLFGLRSTSPCLFSAVQGPVRKPMPPVNNREQQDKGQHFIPTQLLRGLWAMRQLLSSAVCFKKSEEEVCCSSPTFISGHIVSLALCFCTFLCFLADNLPASPVCSMHGMAASPCPVYLLFASSAPASAVCCFVSELPTSSAAKCAW